MPNKEIFKLTELSNGEYLKVLNAIEPLAQNETCNLYGLTIQKLTYHYAIMFKYDCLGVVATPYDCIAVMQAFARGFKTAMALVYEKLEKL